MKKRVVLSAVSVICIGACPLWLARAALDKCLPMREYGRCLEFPGTCYPPKKLNDIINELQKRPGRAKNYQVRIWENGKRTRIIGQMDIDKVTLSETDNNAAINGLTAITVQIGVCNAQPSPGFGAQKSETTDELVEQIKSIVKSNNR